MTIMGDVVLLRVSKKVVRHTAAPRKRHGLAAHSLCGAQRIRHTGAFLLGQPLAPRGLDVEGSPGSVQTIRGALGVTHETRDARVFADTDENPLPGRPWAGDGVRLHVRAKLVVDPLRRPAERKLAKRCEISGGEEVFQGAPGSLRDIDFPLAQPLHEIARGKVNDLDLIGTIDDRIRHCLTHPDPGDLGNVVVQALDVLDIDCGVDVDAGGQQFLDVEVALRMTASRRVRVRQLIDKSNVRPAGEKRIEVHLLE